MALLDKEEMLFERDGKGEIIPKEVVVDRLPDKPTIKILPLTRGEIKAIRAGLSPTGETTEDQDAKILSSKLLEPKITYEELVKYGKQSYVDILVLTILKNSGLNIDIPPKESIDVAENEIKKK